MIKKFGFILIILMLFYSFVFAEQEQNIPQTITYKNKVLTLNGSGIRKKFFIKIYIGALYSEKKITSEKELFENDFTGIIRMKFLYKKVDAYKLQAAFTDDIKENSPNYVNEPAIKNFINTFTFDAMKKDVIDIIIDNGNTVIIKYNNEIKNKIKSRKLVEAVIKIWFGNHPVNENLKKAMLGIN